MAEINWKSKYQSLKDKFMESVDAAFRLGYEQGAQEAQVQQMQQAQQQQAEAEMAQAQMEGQGDEQQDPNAEQGQEQGPPQDSAHPGGSELDQHISQLEGMLGKGEMDMATLIKSVTAIRKFQKDIVLQQGLAKSAAAIPEIAKNLHKPKFKMSANATHNLSNSAKAAVNMQEKVVTEIMAKWDEESKTSSTNILDVIKVEGLTKGEK